MPCCGGGAGGGDASLATAGAAVADASATAAGAAFTWLETTDGGAWGDAAACCGEPEAAGWAEEEDGKGAKADETSEQPAAAGARRSDEIMRATAGCRRRSRARRPILPGSHGRRRSPPISGSRMTPASGHAFCVRSQSIAFIAWPPHFFLPTAKKNRRVFGTNATAA